MQIWTGTYPNKNLDRSSEKFKKNLHIFRNGTERKTEQKKIGIDDTHRPHTSQKGDGVSSPLTAGGDGGAVCFAHRPETRRSGHGRVGGIRQCVIHGHSEASRCWKPDMLKKFTVRIPDWLVTHGRSEASRRWNSDMLKNFTVRISDKRFWCLKFLI